MRPLLTITFFLLTTACAVPPRIVGTRDEREVTMRHVVSDISRADVVALGEMHRTPDVHRTHFELIEAMYAERPEMVIAMEMFERDVQSTLLQYLAGVIDEASFLAAARPWPHYARDYRPVIEFAKRHGIIVIAANAPRPLAGKVAREGIASVAGDPNVARETTAPADEYWQSFQHAMDGHGGVGGEEALKNFYAAQCLKDDTMAESIVDHLRKCPGERPLVVLICGKMHSDHGRGTVQRIKSRMPQLAVRVLSSELSADLSSNIYAAPRDVADYVILVQAKEDSSEQPSKPMPAKPMPAIAMPTTPPPVHAPVHPRVEPVAEHEPAVVRVDSGLLPALGLMPDYESGEAGVLVSALREGGAAELAGMKVGDIIEELAGVRVESVQQYTDALNEQTIGSKVKVRVRRGADKLAFEVVVSSRSR